MGQLGSVKSDFDKADTHANRLFALRDREIQMKKVPKEEEIKNVEIKGNVEFKNVTFAYAAHPDVTILNDVSFNVTSGKQLAIVGPSGSGCVPLFFLFFYVLVFVLYF